MVLYFNTDPDNDWPVFQASSENLPAQETITIAGASYNVYLLVYNSHYYITKIIIYLLT
jgi:hypothetical protein